MPSSYKVTDPVMTTSHRTYDEDEPKLNGSKSKGGSTSNGVSSSNGVSTSNGKHEPPPQDNKSAANEKWRLNYVPTPYGEGSSKASNGLEVQRIENGIPKKKDVSGENGEERGHWGSKAEFLLSCIGLSVGIGNVWRFPYLAYENGGSAFLFPYIILLVLIGKPMYLMETALGQYSQLGPLNVWKCAPVMMGVGVGMVVLSLITSIYYNQLMAYCLYYIFATLAHIGYDVPWSKCHQQWATENCFESGGLYPCQTYNLTEPTELIKCTPGYQNISSATEYWNHAVLRIDPKGLQVLGEIGPIHYDLTLCLLVSWVIVFLCLMKGVKSSGKVVYFTATFPYVILIALLIVGVQLPGASKGLRYLFVPRFSEIWDINVWRKAASQMFFSLSVSWGGLIMFGSYNKFRNKVHIDAFVVSSLDFITSLIAATAVFSILGAMAEDLGLENIKDLAQEGPGLSFIVFPEAISRTLPIPHLWTILFFFMMFTLGLDSEFALLETFLTAVYDTAPSARKYKIPLTGAVCLSCFLLGLPLCSSTGSYIFNLIEVFGSDTGVLLLAIFELIALHWIYGVRRFSNDLKFMLGYSPSMFWKVCWAFVAPVTLAAVFIYSAVEWKTPVSNGVPYPDWAINIGWALSAASVGMVPLFFIIIVLKRLFTGKIKDVFKPSPDWGPGDPEARQQLLDSYSTLRLRESKSGIDNPALDARS